LIVKQFFFNYQKEECIVNSLPNGYISLATKITSLFITFPISLVFSIAHAYLVREFIRRSRDSDSAPVEVSYLFQRR